MKKTFTVNGVKVTREMTEKTDGDYSIQKVQHYIGLNRERVEKKAWIRESDFTSEIQQRTSTDNGRHWGEWKNVQDQVFQQRGNAEKLDGYSSTFFDFSNGRIIRISLSRIFPSGHHKDYENYWGKGVFTFSDHTFLEISGDNGQTWTKQLVRYEDGPAEEPADWLDNAYLKSNFAYLGNRIDIAENGDIVFAVLCSVGKACEILNIDVNTIYPSCPGCSFAAIVMRGKWNQAVGKYDFTSSRPIVIDDRYSSRGLLEPNIIRLKSGKLLLECRGSNAINPNWHTRTTPETPSYRWVALSEDNGETWSDIKPMLFDSGERFYSPSSISHVFRSAKTGKTYWLGNINQEIPSGNDFRNPLNLAEINEDTGMLIKDSLITIDEWEEGQQKGVQLSNFTVTEDRETGDIEIYLSKLGEFENATVFKGNTYKYTLKFLSGRTCGK